jgi:hypothetical protein
VLQIYGEAEADIATAGPVCVASGRCCRFKDYGHTLFISNLEAALLLEDAPPFERSVSGDFCPFQKEKLCTARDARPLGCRVYFCDPTYQDAAQRISETYLRRLKDLADAHSIPWRYAPLHHFLNDPALAIVETNVRLLLDEEKDHQPDDDRQAE